jgi:hypothetical protein
VAGRSDPIERFDDFVDRPAQDMLQALLAGGKPIVVKPIVVWRNS